MPRLHRTPHAVDSHFNAIRGAALVVVAQRAAILVVAAAGVALVDPILIVGVEVLVMLLRLCAQGRERECRREKPAHAGLLSKELTRLSLVSRAGGARQLCAIQYGAEQFVPACQTYRVCARRNEPR